MPLSPLFGRGLDRDATFVRKGIHGQAGLPDGDFHPGVGSARGLDGLYRYGVLDKIIPKAKERPSVVPQKADLPGLPGESNANVARCF